LAMFAGNTGAMVAGHESTIKSIDWEDVQGINTPKVRSSDGRGQITTINGEEVVLAKDGELPKAVTIRFESGRTMTLGLLLQGQDKTTIHFKGDANPTKSVDLNLSDIPKLIGRQFKCVKYFRDAANAIVRTSQVPLGSNDAPASRSYAANCYEFVETTA
jgi:hypothetical protein